MDISDELSELDDCIDDIIVIFENWNRLSDRTRLHALKFVAGRIKTISYELEQKHEARVAKGYGDDQ